MTTKCVCSTCSIIPSVQFKHSSIPWPQIIGLRNRLVHGYDAVDLDILWNIVHTDLPLLVEQLETAIKTER